MSKKQVLDTETTFEQSRVLLQVSEGKLTATQEALQEAEAALAESDAQAHKLWGEELAKASGELAEVQEIDQEACRPRRAADDPRSHTRSACSTCCSALRAKSCARARPSPASCRSGDALVAEVLVKPEDIAAVKVNDKAELKVTAYDFSKYGKIKGEVAFISPEHVRARRQARLLQGLRSPSIRTARTGSPRNGSCSPA